MRFSIPTLSLFVLMACSPPSDDIAPPIASQSTHNLLPAPDLLPPPLASSQAKSASVVEVPTLAQAASAASVAVQAASQVQAASVAQSASAVQSVSAVQAASAPKASFRPLPKDVAAQALIAQAEQQASGKVRDILKTSREMTLINQEIIKGSCWDYLNAAWNRAGVPAEAREVIYADKINGQYAHPDQLQAGDWIYHVNHSYNDIEHSGMFIGWVDKANKQGLTLSYAGEGRQEPARYRVYDLSSVYQITRAHAVPNQETALIKNKK